MLGRTLLFAQLAVLCVLLPLVLFGIAHDYLWSVVWFSATAHFLGGLWAVLCFAWGQSILRLSRNFLTCVIAVFVLGICWEIFELLIEATHFPASTIDTVTDLIMDVIGGIVGVGLLQYLWLRK